MKLFVICAGIVVSCLAAIVYMAPPAPFALRACELGYGCDTNNVTSAIRRWRVIATGSNNLRRYQPPEWRFSDPDEVDAWPARMQAWASSMPLPDIPDEALLVGVVVVMTALLWLSVRLASWLIAILRQRRIERIDRHNREARELALRMQAGAMEADRLIASYMREAFDRARN